MPMTGLQDWLELFKWTNNDRLIRVIRNLRVWRLVIQRYNPSYAVDEGYVISDDVIVDEFERTYSQDRTVLIQIAMNDIKEFVAFLRSSNNAMKFLKRLGRGHIPEGQVYISDNMRGIQEKTFTLGSINSHTHYEGVNILERYSGVIVGLVIKQPLVSYVGIMYIGTNQNRDLCTVASSNHVCPVTIQFMPVINNPGNSSVHFTGNPIHFQPSIYNNCANNCRNTCNIL